MTRTTTTSAVAAFLAVGALGLAACSGDPPAPSGSFAAAARERQEELFGDRSRPEATRNPSAAGRASGGDGTLTSLGAPGAPAAVSERGPRSESRSPVAKKPSREKPERRSGVSSKDEDSSGKREKISRFGITWSFEREVPAGPFANGDWWVVGPVEVVAIDPPSTQAGDRTRNGSMVNPSPRLGARQGYDSAMKACSYDPALNAALGVSRERPLVLEPGSSLVSTISMERPGNRPQLRGASILTVLGERPPEGSFRPPYAGTKKNVRYRVSDLDTSLLARLEPVPSTPPLSKVERYFERPWIDHIPDWNGGFHHPKANMPEYGRDIANQVSIGALMLHLDFPPEDKVTLLTRYVQLGIDLFGVVEDGGNENWVPNGGHSGGRKWPILFAGLVLDDAEMMAIGERKDVFFGEDAQTFYVTADHPGGYSEDDIGLPEWGIRHATDPRRDEKSWICSYRQCCTARVWQGFVLAARIMDAVELWNHDPLFDYVDRYMQVTSKGGEHPGWRCASEFVEEMWDKHRDGFGEVWTRTVGEDRTAKEAATSSGQ